MRGRRRTLRERAGPALDLRDDRGTDASAVVVHGDRPDREHHRMRRLRVE